LKRCFAIQAVQEAKVPGSQTLEQAGFAVRLLSEGKPVYSIKYGANAHPIIGFSKTYDDSFNPQSAFAAILT
jgi:arsenate reductase